MRDNRLAQWVIQGISVLAFLVLVRYLAGAFLPQDGFWGSFRKVVSLGG